MQKETPSAVINGPGLIFLAVCGIIPVAFVVVVRSVVVADVDIVRIIHEIVFHIHELAKLFEI